MDVERARGLIAIQQTISAARGDLRTVMEAIVSERSVMPQSNGIVVELRDGDQLYYAAASGTSAKQVGLRLPLNASLSGLSILIGEPLSCSDSEKDSRVNRTACRRVGLRSMIVVPIPHQGQVVGVLKYHSEHVDAFSDEDMLVAHLLVGPIAVGFASVGEADAVKAQAALQNLVQLKGEFITTVSHELRTPVTSIAGSLGLLASGAVGELPDKIAPLVSIAARNADRVKRLVNDLLDIDKLDSGQLSFHLADADLCEVVRDVAEQNAPFAQEAGVALTLDIPGRSISVLTDAHRLFQAVTNLVSNAAKFSPRGADVTIRLAIIDDQALIQVMDKGPGVPENFRKRLFDRFAQDEQTRTLTSFPGTGLGLAISKGIVEQLGGSIRLDESYAQGAAFEIRLPLKTGHRTDMAA